MPKIIENVREQLLTEARRQIAESGYAKTTIRSVAGACGVGVGTVYNYFKSKEMLIASFILEDWRDCLQRMAVLLKDDPKVLLQGIYTALRDFEEENHSLFSDADAAKAVILGFSSRHKLLRKQIADVILPCCEKHKVSNPSFAAEYIAESLLCWSMENIDFDTIYPLLDRIIKNEKE